MIISADFMYIVVKCCPLTNIIYLGIVIQFKCLPLPNNSSYLVLSYTYLFLIERYSCMEAWFLFTTSLNSIKKTKEHANISSFCFWILRDWRKNDNTHVIFTYKHSVFICSKLFDEKALKQIVLVRQHIVQTEQTLNCYLDAFRAAMIWLHTACVIACQYWQLISRQEAPW